MAAPPPIQLANHGAPAGEELPNVAVPVHQDYEVQIAVDEREACRCCKLWRAMFIMKPCNDFGVCISCLLRHKATLQRLHQNEKCIFCKGDVTSYVKCNGAVKLDD